MEGKLGSFIFVCLIGVFYCISLPFSCFTLKKTGNSVKVHRASLALLCTHITVYFPSVSLMTESGADGLC